MASTIPDWLEVANSCNSAYKKNDLGWILYGLVRAYKPLVCVELGVLEGYSTIFIAQALKDNSNGHLWGYDLFEDYPYRNAVQGTTEARIDAAGLTPFVNLIKCDVYTDPPQHPNIDFLHIDLSNDGKVIQWAIRTFYKFLSRGSLIVFEGGSKERDECDWMLTYNKTPIRSVLGDIWEWSWMTFQPYPSMTIMVPR